MNATQQAVPRCGDIILHRPSGDQLTVAFADPASNSLAWFGWPEGLARLTDCELVTRCTDAEHEKAVAEWLDTPHNDDRGREDGRVSMVRHLYRPAEERAMRRRAIARACVDLRKQITLTDSPDLDAYDRGKVSVLHDVLRGALAEFALAYGLALDEVYPRRAEAAPAKSTEAAVAADPRA